jgi:hypothetical protein
MWNGGAHRERDRITIPSARTASPRPPRQFGSDFRTSTIFVCCKRGDLRQWKCGFCNTPNNVSELKRAAGNGVKLVISQGLNVAVDV